MKKYILMFAIAGIAISSCKENEKTETETETVDVTTVANEAARNGNSETVMSADVPDTIRTSFMVKNPGATKVIWKKYEPQEDDGLSRNDEYWYATYYNEGADYSSWYNNNGLWVKTSTKISGPSELPDAVNKTINAQYPGYTIVEIDKENDKDMDMYEIELKKGDQKAKLKILPNGQVFKRK